MQASDNNKPQELTRAERREKAAADALRSLIRDTLLDKFPLLAEENPNLALKLSLNIQCDDPGALTFDPPLRQQILDQAEAYLTPRETFQFGSLFDFHAQRNCRPPDALAVFAGYDAMGHPKWSPVTDLLANDLFLKIFSGKELKTEQLKTQGKNSKTYNILGQVVLGPLPVPQSYQKLTRQPQWGLTCQIVETRDTRNHFALKLNLLIGGLLPEELDEMIQEIPLRDLNHAVLKLQEDLQGLEQRALDAWEHQDTRKFNGTLKQIPGLLSEFSETLYPSPIPSPSFPKEDIDAVHPED